MTARVRLACFRLHRAPDPAAEAAIRSFVDAVRASEPRTLEYESYRDLDDPTRFFHLMRFADGLAQREHRHTDHVRRFVDRLYPACAEAPVFHDLEPFAGQDDRGTFPQHPGRLGRLR